MTQLSRRFASALFLVALSMSARAAVVYNEGTDGDFSNDGLSPTLVSLTSGANSIAGVTGASAAGIDLDYFTFVVPAGQQISSFTVDSPQTKPLGVSFIGVQAGDQVTLPPTTQSPAGLIGWSHYSEFDGDILVPLFGGPAAAGSYAFWVQEFSFGESPYQFTVTLTPTAVPEPESYALLALGLGGICVAVRRRAARA